MASSIGAATGKGKGATKGNPATWDGFPGSEDEEVVPQATPQPQQQQRSTTANADQTGQTTGVAQGRGSREAQGGTAVPPPGQEGDGARLTGSPDNPDETPFLDVLRASPLSQPLKNGLTDALGLDDETFISDVLEIPDADMLTALASMSLPGAGEGERRPPTPVEKGKVLSFFKSVRKQWLPPPAAASPPAPASLVPPPPSCSHHRSVGREGGRQNPL